VQIFFILAIPLLLSIVAMLSKDTKRLSFLNSLGHAIVLAFSACLVLDTVNFSEPKAFFNFFYIDSLSVFFIFTISVINLASSLYSIGYTAMDLKEGVISERKAVKYYVLFNLFSFSMFFVTVVNNLGMLWVAVEMTTLVSAFLVGFYNNKKSIEAAWKYIIICSVGISLALLGTILFYFTASQHGNINSLNWTDIVSVAKKLDPRVVKAAFLFILVGYGTKAGLAPMHTWLPDAHSQALSPTSALLSGVLLKTAIYAVLRFAIITNKCIGIGYVSNLFILFGLLSLCVSAGFILVQKDIKRMFAYSSVEHIGIITLGFGFGGPIGLYGALLHIFNHAVTKSLMFFGAGSIVKKYHTNNMNVIKGVIAVLPFTGIILIFGVFALIGMPPFSIFISEIIILIGGFKAGFYFPSALFLFFAAIVFGGMLFRFGKILFGKKPQDMAAGGERLSGKLAFVFLFSFIIVLGFTIPGFLNKILLLAVEIISGA